MLKFSSPSRGSYISTMLADLLRLAVDTVLVPFSGFLYLYATDNNKDSCYQAFSSPSRGSYISTEKN